DPQRHLVAFAEHFRIRGTGGEFLDGDLVAKERDDLVGDGSGNQQRNIELGDLLAHTAGVNTGDDRERICRNGGLLGRRRLLELRRPRLRKEEEQRYGRYRWRDAARSCRLRTER